jgi:hypothetical protein
VTRRRPAAGVGSICGCGVGGCGGGSGSRGGGGMGMEGREGGREDSAGSSQTLAA